MKPITSSALALILLLPLAACSQSRQADSQPAAAGNVAQAMKEAGEKTSSGFPEKSARRCGRPSRSWPPRTST